ncbi:MAG TPA: XRE family transcriptional regulator [Myxococcota bacterium]|nr:XRE family transcriptional regulator [Myxococcota bacterium]
MARKRRRISTSIMAERVLASRATLAKVEAGDPSVSMGIYATVLFVLGLHENLNCLADPGKDLVGLDLEEERLPKRIKRRSSLKVRPPDGT